MINRQQIRSILIIQLRAIGDVVLTTAVLPVLRKHFPQAQIHFLTGKGIGGLLTSLPNLDKVLEFPYPPQYLPGVFRFLPLIRRQYDLIIDFQGTPGTALLTHLSGARLRLGWANSRRRYAYNLTSRGNETEEYVPLQKCRMLVPLGIEELNAQPRVAFSNQDLEQALNFLESEPIEPGSLKVNLGVKGKRQARHYFPDRFARLNDLLVSRLGAQTFFNQAPGEEDYVANVAALCKYPPIILPRWSLPFFAAFLSLIDLHISYDNGARHIAVALNTPTISFYGSANPVYWNPPQDANHPHILKDVPCRLCGLKECGLMICMESIQPEEVLELIPGIPRLASKFSLKAVR